MKTLVRNEEQFVTNARGTRVGVVLDLRTYKRLRDAEEELADIRAYDRARPKVRREIATGHSVSLREYRSQRAGKRA
jgi:N-glycosylase/DNA lyase